MTRRREIATVLLLLAASAPGAIAESRRGPRSTFTTQSGAVLTRTSPVRFDAGAVASGAKGVTKSRHPIASISVFYVYKLDTPSGGVWISTHVDLEDVECSRDMRICTWLAPPPPRTFLVPSGTYSVLASALDSKGTWENPGSRIDVYVV